MSGIYRAGKLSQRSLKRNRRPRKYLNTAVAAVSPAVYTLLVNFRAVFTFAPLLMLTEAELIPPQNDAGTSPTEPARAKAQYASNDQLHKLDFRNGRMSNTIGKLSLD